MKLHIVDARTLYGLLYGLQSVLGYMAVLYSFWSISKTGLIFKRKHPMFCDLHGVSTFTWGVLISPTVASGALAVLGSDHVGAQLFDQYLQHARRELVHNLV